MKEMRSVTSLCLYLKSFTKERSVFSNLIFVVGIDKVD